jgi:YegS/Rv2252/BmrU family lipid kinase
VTKRALLLINQHARHGNKIAEAIDCLKQAGLVLLEASTDQSQNLADIIRQHRDQVDLVIVGGGDGTLNAAVDGLVETKLPLGILPLGTANDLARTLDIPTHLRDACQVIVAGHQEQIDLGWVNGKHFFNVASLGLSVQITRKLDKNLKRRWGVLAYAIAALKVLAKARPFSAQIRLNEGEPFVLKTVQIAVGNGRYYGGGMAVDKQAAINDQRLDIYSLNLDHWWQMLMILPAMRSGHHTSSRFVTHFRCREVEVDTRREHDINTDGEILTKTPAHFRVIPKTLTVFVPASDMAATRFLRTLE